MGNKKLQVIEPSVSQQKFVAEIREFRQIERDWRKKGVLCLDTSFPFAEFLFTALNMKPNTILFAVSIDFTNYDLQPPSIVFIDPFTGHPVLFNEMQVKFFQVNAVPVAEAAPGMIIQTTPQLILMMGTDRAPFLCIPGVREYHEHPAHSNDPWLRHRGKGEGKLCFLLDQLYNHSVPYVTGLNLNLNISVNGIKQF